MNREMAAVLQFLWLWFNSFLSLFCLRGRFHQSFPGSCFILQLYIHYAGEHQSQPVHGHKTESYISEGEDSFCPTPTCTHSTRRINKRFTCHCLDLCIYSKYLFCGCVYTTSWHLLWIFLCCVSTKPTAPTCWVSPSSTLESWWLMSERYCVIRCCELLFLSQIIDILCGTHRWTLLHNCNKWAPQVPDYCLESAQ